MPVHLIVRGKPVDAFGDSRGRERGQCLAGALMDSRQAQGVPTGISSGLPRGSLTNASHGLIMRVERPYSKCQQ
ncbi:MAG TPA: hypothetical protein VII92_15950 [Anaerolineae bacterium]